MLNNREGKFPAEVAQDRLKTLELDPWQAHCVDSMIKRRHLIVDAPTSAGKTRIIEAWILEQFAKGITPSCIYTTPIKSLANDKLREFSLLFGSDNVGIATGDFKKNLNAPIIIATLETYRNALLGVSSAFQRALVVFDEYQYLADPSRGSAWEEAILLTPPDTRLLFLSASVANARSFSKWLSFLFPSQEAEYLKVTKRPVPLTHRVYHPKSGWQPLDESRRPPQKEDRNQKDSGGKHRGHSGGRMTQNMESICARLADADEYLPILVYVGRRKACVEFAQSLKTIQKEKGRLKEAHRVKKAEIDAILKQYKVSENKEYYDPSLMTMILDTGIGYHHSGLTPWARLLVEDLLKRGLLQFCVATMGLSVGINFSVKGVAVVDDRRPSEGGTRVRYAPSEILQMIGRAGRRGRDKEGYCLWVDDHLADIFSKSKPENLSSQIKFTPSTILGLLPNYPSLEALLSVFDRSLSFYHDQSSLPFMTPTDFGEIYQSSDPKVDKQKHAQQAKNRGRKAFRDEFYKMANHLKEIACLDEDAKLTQMGDIARYVPQFGGMWIAQQCVLTTNNPRPDHFIHNGSFLFYCGAFSMAHFKEPQKKVFDYFREEELPQTIRNESQRNFKTLLQQLERLYPKHLFPEHYDEGVIREFNPQGGVLIHVWMRNEISFSEFAAACCTNKFEEGDLIQLIARSASYLLSLTHAALAPQEIESLKLAYDRLTRDDVLEYSQEGTVSLDIPT